MSKLYKNKLKFNVTIFITHFLKYKIYLET
jgi:hypothetical protein